MKFIYGNYLRNGVNHEITLRINNWRCFCADINIAAGFILDTESRKLDWEDVLREEENTRKLLQPGWNCFSGPSGSVSFNLRPNLYKKFTKII